MQPRRGRTTKKLITLAQDKFYACEVCMPKGDLAYIEDLLVPLKLNKRELFRLDRHLTCPGCESCVTLFDRIVPYAEGSTTNERRFRKWIQYYARDYASFRRFLEDHTQLGSKHTFGRRLTDEVRRATVTIVDPSTWYRVVNGNLRFNSEKFFDPRASRAGRYNREGQAAFYMADSSKTAALELLKESKMNSGIPMWVATLQLRRSLRIINLGLPFPGSALTQPLTLAGLVLSGETRRKGLVPETDHLGYVLPQFLADLIRERDVDGIQYTSCRGYPYRPEVCGTCLVVFRPDFRDFADILEVQKFEWKTCVVDPPFDLPDMDLFHVEGRINSFTQSF